MVHLWAWALGICQHYSKLNISPNHFCIGKLIPNWTCPCFWAEVRKPSIGLWSRKVPVSRNRSKTKNWRRDSTKISLKAKGLWFRSKEQLGAIRAAAERRGRSNSCSRVKTIFNKKYVAVSSQENHKSGTKKRLLLALNGKLCWIWFLFR